MAETNALFDRAARALAAHDILAARDLFGLPVTRGEKLIASRWIRQRRFEPPGAAEA